MVVSLKVTIYKDGVSFPVKVKPRAQRNTIVGVAGGVLRIHLTAPPDQGKANAALIELLSERLAVKRNQVEILTGLTSRNKVVRVAGITPDILWKVQIDA